MTSLVGDATTVAPPRPAFWPRLGGAALGRGLVVGYISVIVLIPLAAIFSKAFSDGLGAFWHQVTTPEAVATLKLTFVCSLIVVAINVVTGLSIAWVLVRDNFPGKKLINSVIDLPFALPTIVAGLVLLSLYGNDSPIGISLAFTQASVVVALLFVTLPFVVRSVQPVLMELDQDMEEAAASLGAGPITVFRRIVLPNLTPAILAGAALAFARAIGEYGSLVLHLRAPSRSRPRPPRCSSSSSSSRTTRLARQRSQWSSWGSPSPFCSSSAPSHAGASAMAVRRNFGNTPCARSRWATSRCSC